jgi:hypothetical protein
MCQVIRNTKPPRRWGLAMSVHMPAKLPDTLRVYAIHAELG